ncbi:MAG: TIGR01212 family radical SAM protein [Bacilli bacterium]|nr:TIGR01212 family radical SAM protein [Bacilli bacterium]
MKQFIYSYDNKRYHTLDYYNKQKYRTKICKISLNAGFTCPNIDGTKGKGGCIYCSPSGSGDFAGNPKEDLLRQFDEIKQMMQRKWKDAKYVGYFQAHSNTYAPVSVLKEKYECILDLENVVGLAIATRPDCITEECLDYLEQLNQKTDLTIELGLQTIHEKTTDLINRCHDVECLDEMVRKLADRNIKVVVHIINGLPYETKEMMVDTVKHVNTLPIHGVKIHMMHILEKTALAVLYRKEPFPVLSKEEYVDIICEQLKYLKPEIVIHRITGDPKVEDLVAPTWLVKKFCVLNDIDKEMKKRDIYQGDLI